MWKREEADTVTDMGTDMGMDMDTGMDTDMGTDMDLVMATVQDTDTAQVKMDTIRTMKLRNPNFKN